MARGSLDNGVVGEENLRAWLDAYGRAWEGRDPLRAASLFTEDASYEVKPSPFEGPLRGKKAILDYWERSTDGATDVSFEFEVLAVEDGQGMARWWASIRDRGAVNRLGGVFVVTLAGDNRCRELREWWNPGEPANGDRAPESARGEGEALDEV